MPEPEIVNDFMHFVNHRTFVPISDWKTKTPNMPKLKMAIERIAFVVDKDKVKVFDA